MPLHDYKCPAGHITTRLVSIKDELEPLDVVVCRTLLDTGGLISGSGVCSLVAERLPSSTGTPILKAGVGGFYRPSRA